MSALQVTSRDVAQTIVTGDRIDPGPIAQADDTDDPLRDGHEVGVLLARPHRDAEYTVERLVNDPRNLPDPIFEKTRSLIDALTWTATPETMIAARATLQAVFGDTAADDAFTFTGVRVLRHESTQP